MNLTVENLTKVYNNGVRAIDHLSLEIGAGMFGLLGPNGAGKSTLMRTIATMQKPDRGTITFNNINVLEDPMSLRKILGYLPQDFGVYPKVSAEKLLDYLAILKGIGSKMERNMIVNDVLALTNLNEVRKKSVSGYSGGMKQRFGIAQLLLNNPQLIIVDEPTSGLDPAERKRFLNVLREIGTNNTVIFSTHLVEDVMDLCNNLAIINGGKILMQDTPGNSIQKIDGKIWTKKILSEDLQDIEERYNVLSSSYNDDNSLTVRIYADYQIDESFIQSFPTLEDVYFTVLKKEA